MGEVTHVEPVIQYLIYWTFTILSCPEALSTLSPSDEILRSPLKSIPWMELSLPPLARDLVLWLALIKWSNPHGQSNGSVAGERPKLDLLELSLGLIYKSYGARLLSWHCWSPSCSQVEKPGLWDAQRHGALNTAVHAPGQNQKWNVTREQAEGGMKRQHYQNTIFVFYMQLHGRSLKYFRQ